MSRTEYDLILTPEDAAILVQYLSRNRIRELDGPARAIVEKLQVCAAQVPPPRNGDRLWNGLTVGIARNGKTHNQCSTVVRAKSKAEAVRLLKAAGEHLGIGHFNAYWSEAASREMQCVATERGVWAKGTTGWVKGRGV